MTNKKSVEKVIEKPKRKLEDICNEGYQNYLDNTKDAHERLLVLANQYWIETKYSGNTATINVKWDDFFKKNEVNKDTQKLLRSTTIPIYHPRILYDAILDAKLKNNLDLCNALEKEMDKKFPDEKQELMDEVYKINGSTEINWNYDDYKKRTKVANFIENGGLTDLNKVRGFRNELKLKNIEGYIKYDLDSKKGKYLYFSFQNLYNELGEQEAFRFIDKVTKMKELNECNERKSVRTLRIQSSTPREKSLQMNISNKVRNKDIKMN